MKTIMQKYYEVHENDGVILYFCFLQQFAGTNAKKSLTLIPSSPYPRQNYPLTMGTSTNFTNAVRAPIRHHLKAKENLSAHHYLYIFHGCLDAPNKELQNFIFQKEACFHHGGPSLLTPPRSSWWAWYRVQENQQPRAMAQARRPSSFSPSQQPPFSPGQLYFAPKGLNLNQSPTWQKDPWQSSPKAS
jgi:hypothetical protein